jgi:tetratricopeptide (TPR) repeat protein
VLCLAAFLIYWPALNGAFIWDDWQNIVTNPLIRANGGILNFWLGREGVYDYYPLTWTTWWLEWRAWRRETMGYHVLNVLLHAAAAAMLWRLLVRLRVPGAFVAACLFLVHPVNVESVAWITERKNTLSMPLMLAALALYLDADEGRGRRALYWGAVGVFLLALLAKPAVVMLPAVMLVIAGWRRGRVGWADVRAVIPFAVLSAVFAVVTIVVHHTRGIVTSEIRADTFAARLAGVGWIVGFYLRKLLWPTHLSLIYPQWTVDPHNVVHWLPLAALLAVIAGLFFARRFIGRAPVAALACYVAMLLPVLGFVDIYLFRYAWVADHFQYQACPAIFAAVAAGGALVVRRLGRPGRFVGPALGAAACAALAVPAWREAHHWRDGADIWADVYRENPRSAIAIVNFAAFHLLPRGRYDEARAMYQRAIELDPRARETYMAMGGTYLAESRVREAIPWLRKAVELPGGGNDPRVPLAEALAQTGSPEEAAEWYERSLAADPLAATFHRELGMLHESAGRVDRALDVYRAGAETVGADDPDAWVRYGMALRRHGRTQDADAAFVEARRLSGDDPAVLCALGDKLMIAGFPDAAAAAYADATRQRPDYGPAHNKLGEALVKLNRPAEAAHAFEQALKAQPGFYAPAEHLRRLRGGPGTAPTTAPDE